MADELTTTVLPKVHAEEREYCSSHEK